jgi:hypothetical protein
MQIVLNIKVNYGSFDINYEYCRGHIFSSYIQEQIKLLKLDA